MCVTPSVAFTFAANYRFKGEVKSLQQNYMHKLLQHEIRTLAKYCNVSASVNICMC